MQNEYYTFNMLSAQAWYVRDLITKKIDRKTPFKDTDGVEWTNDTFEKA